jgi:tripeptide aminopeptidase
VERLHETFVRLCEIRSPTGEEREVADTLLAELRALGLEVAEDDAAGPARAGAGNILARLPGRSDEWVMFCGHIDTVPHEGQIEVVNDEGVFRSAGETILGADNKAAVAVFMELVARHADEPPPVGIELLFTVAEEQGLRGAKAFDTGALRAECGVVLDHATPIGEVITSSPTQQQVRAAFTGVEAHAGIRPEDGHNAIAAAAAAIDRMELGRLDESTTANVGTIAGGTSGNVVPGHCEIVAEARSLDAGRAAAVAGELTDACAWGASEHGCDADVRVEELFRGYELPQSSPSVALAEEGLRRAGVEPVRIATGGGSDANALIAAGLDCVLLANGTEANHTPEESVPARSLDLMLEVCEGIVAAAGDGGG